jgi:hypothetical protein
VADPEKLIIQFRLNDQVVSLHVNPAKSLGSLKATLTDKLSIVGDFQFQLGRWTVQDSDFCSDYLNEEFTIMCKEPQRPPRDVSAGQKPPRASELLQTEEYRAGDGGQQDEEESDGDAGLGSIFLRSLLPEQQRELQQNLDAGRKARIPKVEAAGKHAAPQSDFETDFKIWVPARSGNPVLKTFKFRPSTTLAAVEAEIRRTTNLDELDFSLDDEWDELVSKDTTIGSIDLQLHCLSTRERPKVVVPTPAPGGGPGTGYAQPWRHPSDPVAAPTGYEAGAVVGQPFAPDPAELTIVCSEPQGSPKSGATPDASHRFPGPDHRSDTKAPASECIKRFDHMSEIRILGKGALGTVKLMEDAGTKERFAVKFFNEPGGANPDFGANFMREVELMISLQHPCILRIVGYSLPTHTLPAQIGTVFAANGSLRCALDSHLLDNTGIVIVICGLVRGLQFLHSKNVMHRDLKPENILLDEHQWPQIGDFGSSRLLDLDLTQTRQPGTPLYMAPELYDETGYTTAVDIFSFGLILYELLVGRRAFSSTIAPYVLMKKVTTGDRPEIPADVSEAGCKMIKRCWNVDPAIRPSIDEVAAEFEAIQFRVKPNVDTRRLSAFIASLSPN